MTPKAQRIAIAEACGLKLCPFHGVHHLHRLSECTRHECTDAIPDYLSDLSAMHEAEKVKEMTFNSDYVWWLGRITCEARGMNPDKQDEIECRSMAVFATAAQRAEAFLRTLSLWNPES